MNNDRRSLAWLAIACTIALCLPCTCMGLFFGFVSLINQSDTSYRWTGTDTTLLIIGLVFTILPLVAGIFLTGWGVKTLLGASESGVIQERQPPPPA